MRALAHIDTLRYAWSKLNKRKRSAGVDGISIERFARSSENHLQQISRQLWQGTYKFSPSKGVLRQKPEGKQRPLRIATVSDRVVTKALALHLKPHLIKFDKDCSFAYRENRSTADAVQAIVSLANAGNRWILEADIKGFFDNVDRQLLKKKLRKVFKSRKLIAFIDKALTSEIGNLDAIQQDLRDLFPSASQGIPQGNMLSPLLANYFMLDFDEAMCAKGFGLVRYADDFVVMCKTREEANDAYEHARKFLTALKLEIHPLSKDGKTQIRRYSEGFNFVGFLIKDQKLLASEKTRRKCLERLKEILTTDLDQSLHEKVQRINNVCRGWFNAYKLADLGNFPNEADDMLYREISALFLRKKLLQKGSILDRLQMKFIGVKSLGSLHRDQSKTRSQSRQTHRPPRHKSRSATPLTPSAKNPSAS